MGQTPRPARVPLDPIFSRRIGPLLRTKSRPGGRPQKHGGPPCNSCQCGLARLRDPDRDILVAALPGSARFGALLLHGAFKFYPIHLDSSIVRYVFNKVARKAICVIEPEGFISTIN